MSSGVVEITLRDGRKMAISPRSIVAVEQITGPDGSGVLISGSDLTHPWAVKEGYAHVVKLWIEALEWSGRWGD